MSRSVVVTLVALAALAPGLTSCRELGLPCVAAEDCLASEVCVAGSCVVACNVDGDCGAAEVCDNGLCKAEGEGDAGEGEGDVVGEGEGDVVVGEGEGDGVVGEGEGDVVVGEGEGDVVVGEGEGDGVVGEGEGEPAEDPGAPDACGAADPFRADLNGDCQPDLAIGAPGASRIFVVGSKVDRVLTQGFDLDWDFDDAIIGIAPAGSRLGQSIALAPDKTGVVRRMFPSSPGQANVRELVPNKGADQTFDEAFPGTIDVGGTNPGAVMAVSRNDAGGAAVIAVSTDDGGGSVILGGAVASPIAFTIRRTIGVPVRAIVRVPDRDGDGAEDFLVGAPGASFPPAAGTFGVFALSSADLSVIESFRAATPAGSTSFGTSVASLDDVDGDARQDFVVGAPDDEIAGAVHVFLSGDNFSDHVIHAPPGIRDRARFGFAVSALADFDGDGKNDLAIGAPFDADLAAGDDPECDDVAPGAYVGDCSGTVFAIGSTEFLAGPATPFVCLRLFSNGTRFARTRLGFALRALGPHPESRDLGQRLAVGGPGTPNPTGDPGLVAVFTFTVNNRQCLSAEPQGTVLAFLGPTASGFGGGDDFGASFGQ